MDYREFKDFIREHIKEHLPEAYADHEVHLTPTVKNNDTVLDGLAIKSEDSNIAPNIYLNGYFADYQAGREMDSILSEIADIRVQMEVEQGFDLSQVMDFDKAKDHIGCKLIHAEQNGQYLSDKPHTMMEDLAVTYHIQLDQSDRGSCSVPLNNRLMESYGISTEELHQIAIKNMDSLAPGKFASMNEIMAELMLSDIMRDYGVDKKQAEEIISQMMPPEEGKLYCLTNEMKLNGAATILDSDLMDRIAEQLGGDFYILPSSIHEVLIVPKEAGTDYRELEAMVQEVNAAQVSPEEKLSDHVYEYDSKAHEIYRSDRAGERKAVKEAEKEKEGKPEQKRSLKERLAEKKTQASHASSKPEPEQGRKKGMEL